jgi:outer membrane murein-binding lipoprotein Lpp
VNNDQSGNNGAPKVISLDKAQTKHKRLVRQARRRAVNRKSTKTKLGRVQRLRARVERLELRLNKLRGRISLNEERLAKAKSRLEKAVSAAATGKGPKKARAKRAASG